MADAVDLFVWGASRVKTNVVIVTSKSTNSLVKVAL
jgi:hypothetical protein